MEDSVPFASGAYFAALGILVFARGMDFLSTWVATPHLVLEGNPLAKWLGWKWGAVVNAAFCVALARWPLPAMILSTTSMLVAARNFQQAWLMRSMGEELYRDWHVARLQETRMPLFLFCLFGQTALTAGLGAGLIFQPAGFTGADRGGIWDRGVRRGGGILHFTGGLADSTGDGLTNC